MIIVRTTGIDCKARTTCFSRKRNHTGEILKLHAMGLRQLESEDLPFGGALYAPT